MFTYVRQTTLRLIFGLSVGLIFPGILAMASTMSNVYKPIRANVNIEGRTLSLMLDTSQRFSLISLSEAKANQLKQGRRSTIYVADETLTARQLLPATVVFGKTVVPVALNAVDFNSLSPASHARYANVSGVLGMSFADGRIFRLDFRSGSVRLLRSYHCASTAYSRPIGLINGVPSIPLVDLHIKGERLPAVIDTFFPGFVALNQAALRLLELPAGGSTAKQSPVPVSVGPYDLGRVDVTSLQDHNPLAQGHIGIAALQQFHVTIDYKNGHVCLEK